MAMYAQHGHGKSYRIDSALATGSIDGVIFGARNEKIENIKSCVDKVREESGIVFLDPQFHVSALTPPNDRFLPDYPYYKAGRTSADFIGVKKISSHVKTTLDFELALQLDKLLSPTVIFDSFESKWCQTALNLADASLEYHASLTGAPPLLLSFVIGEEALESRIELDDFLDQVTSWETVSGVYIILSRESSSYSQRFEPERLANALYLNYVLGSINGLEVINGYTDFCGLLFRSVGGSAFATGWSQSLRQFHKRSFTKHKPGGQQAKLRYTSIPLLNSILLTELQQIYESGRLDMVLSGVPLDKVITDADSLEDSWNALYSELHHWESLKTVEKGIGEDVLTNLSVFEERITSAQELYVMLKEDGVIFGPQTRPDHLKEWIEAIEKFREIASL
jgi:hypothetical protein